MLWNIFYTIAVWNILFTIPVVFQSRAGSIGIYWSQFMVPHSVRKAMCPQLFVTRASSTTTPFMWLTEKYQIYQTEVWYLGQPIRQYEMQLCVTTWVFKIIITLSILDKIHWFCPQIKYILACEILTQYTLKEWYLLSIPALCHCELDSGFATEYRMTSEGITYSHNISPWSIMKQQRKALQNILLASWNITYLH